MSFEAMAWAMKQKTGNPSRKLILLTLANHANGHTGQCNPKIKRIAEECEMSESTVKGHLAALAESGFIRVENRFSEGVQISNQYWLAIDGGRPTGGVGQNLAGGGSESGGGVGQNLATNKQEVKKQELNQINPDAKAPVSTKKNPIEIKTFIADCKASGQQVIPESDPIFDYAEKAGIPPDHLRLCFREFVDRMGEAKTRKTDWRAHFRNCVRGNWYRLWYIGEDGYELTTAGKQAQLKHGRAAA